MRFDLAARPRGLAESERGRAEAADGIAVEGPAAKDELAAVVVGRVVRAGDHDAAIHAQRRRGVIKHRGRPEADPHDIEALGRQAFDQGGLEIGRGQPPVIAGRDAAAAGSRESLRVGAADRQRIGGKEGFADDPANVVFAQDRRVETM